MRAVVVDRFMAPSALTVSEVPDPVVGAGMVGIDIRAAGCNFFDILQVQGKYQNKPPFPFIPGAECAGVVREVGASVHEFAVGDRVVAGLILGAFAERIALHASRISKMPIGMSFEEAAAFPVVYPTSYAALVTRAHLRRGETVLVTAAAGGVGLAAVQIAKALGARVIAAAGGPDKLAIARAAGADVLVDYHRPDWPIEVRRATDDRGVSVVVESVGGEVFDGALKCLAWEGRLVVVGFASGQIPEIKANRLLLKNISVMGLFLGTYMTNNPSEWRAIGQALLSLFEEKKLAPKIWKTYPLAEVAVAMEALGARKTCGKVVLIP
ncbi:MAG: NADPH:quinone oxidoreductase family protein [Polyangiales bacterium]